MRKTILLTLLTSLLLFTSCHKSYKDVEENAKIALTNAIYAEGFLSYEISNYEVTYIDDSLCTMNFHLAGYPVHEKPVELDIVFTFLCYNGDWYTDFNLKKYAMLMSLSSYTIWKAENNPDKKVVERLHKEREKTEKTGNDQYSTAYTYMIAAGFGKKADLEYKCKLNIVDTKTNTD
ncbi:MAG: hypothetical protein LUC88_10480 [Prevotella sp.]|nr:hypothetical protein [Prevotella sp.]